MEVQVKTEDIQAVMAGNPQMALQVENQALRRCLGKIEEDLTGCLSELEAKEEENKLLAGELEKLKNGKKEK